MGSDERPDDVVKEILTYFVRHPHAADDLEGVARWRLAQAAIRARVEETRAVLESLVEKGFLRGTRTTGSTTVFSLNPDALDEIRAFLEIDDAESDRKP